MRMITVRSSPARYASLLSAGAHVYEYQPTTLHAKTFVVDARWVSISRVLRSLAKGSDAGPAPSQRTT
jgi:hypothetical protein